MKKKLLVIMICFAVLTAFMPALAPQADAATKSIRYVALGDSAAMGYGMSSNAGYGVLTEGTYPALITKTFAKRGIAVSTDQMAMKGMRVEELRYLLDSSYAGDGYLQENFSDLSNLRSEYRTKIKNANLISLELGDENFGSYVLYLAQDVDNRCTDAAVKKLVASDKDGIKASLTKELNAAVKQVPEYLRKKYNVDQVIADNSEKYIDAAAYVYYSFCMNFDESVRLIKKQNPSCDLIVLGLRNPYEGLSVKAKLLALYNMSLAVGDIYNNQVVAKANAHMKSNSNVTGFADVKGTADFMDETAAYRGEPSALKQSFKDYCDIYEDDFLLASSVEGLDGYADLSDSEKEAVMNAAYDVVGSCLCDVANLSQPLTLNMPLTRLTSIESEVAGITTKAPELMAGIKSIALECAAGTIADSSYTYPGDFDAFVSSTQYGSTEEDQEMGKIIMAFGIRTAMGEGFFNQPSSEGHSQISSAVMKLYDGFCKNSSVGHKYGAWKVVSTAGFCKDGKSQRVCSRCGHVDVKTTAGYGPNAIKIKKLKKGKKSFTVKWKKLSTAKQKKITGFQIRYSTSKSMKKVKTVTIKKKKASSKKIKKLKSKKVYYVQIRTYKSSGGKNYYSSWSGKKKVKTK